MKKILLAGATGYLGQYIAAELKKQQFHTSVIARNPQKFAALNMDVDQVHRAEVTRPDTLNGIFNGVDVVISTVGITRQKDGLSYMDVDYRANHNLLEQAKKSGVKKFIYVSVLHGEKLTGLAICRAKEKFVTELKASGLEYCIIRPTGFFSDMTEFHTMARRGSVYLFGDGRFQSNPIHGADLAALCVRAIHDNATQIEAGGPEIFTATELAELAFDALDKKARIRYLPDGLRRVLLRTGRYLLPRTVYGPMEFFLTVMAMDMVAPGSGQHTLYTYFKSLDK